MIAASVVILGIFALFSSKTSVFVGAEDSNPRLLMKCKT